MNNMNDVIREVEAIRSRYGVDAVTSPSLSSDGVASYTVLPGEDQGYVQEYDLSTGLERHCGLGQGCYWTDWE
jgi:hypothetical protein